ncbi:glycosyl transferase [Candidatus Gottesmanbacteria bacterium RIFCSPHIGHO2_02_FULL_40_24]|uniref:Glycosyl transferase n=1 Tax=Candidatus Gottesmanbacteria bacterium RIFCSPHIGHO2_01_FULL_40_15 TaxID=1798376 RepID=A0A1F5Z237_9BACT|nr:MAG: glycosyl transferase [Candidatus Gottesmanbacteria bacterium RIFCSPHIGHO2_01_FULL_40_15]OGG16132.1 MAG: glycosyl transferase [Candidatus Gottesmanbacteria bacterium RIFCSPHIGHO2_02_FULL_40_24]OGG31698.1 MAG: glycosyl transferase [Candidatus Gottesmanbacteria bacterium RIFCSPLOWO2_02_FULL_40_10]
MQRARSVEVVIPIYNEQEELADSIIKLRSFLKKNLKDFNWHITIADNASTDESLNIARKLKSRYTGVGFIHLDEKGRGRAVKKAWQTSRADFLSYMDVDLSSDLRYFRTLITALVDGYDISIGNRLMKGSIVKKRPLKREVLSRGYNILIKLLFLVHFSDAQCGFKAVNRKVADRLLPNIKDNAWFFDSELLITGEKVGYKIFQVPVSWTDNPGSTVRVLKTVSGDLAGLLRLFLDRPWRKINKV